MYRMAYRNFGDHQSIVVNHTVDVGADRAGIRWYDLTKTSGNWSINQQSTYAPSDGLHRWMGSSAMDQDGNMAIGFSIGNGTAPNYPSIKYVGRLATDPPNELPQAEELLIAGTGSQTHSAGRWGDYSMLATDPVDDCTFWFTTEYIQTTSSANWKTRIGSFKFPTCGWSAATSASATTSATSATSATATATATATSATAIRHLRHRHHRLRHLHHLRHRLHLRHLRHLRRHHLRHRHQVRCHVPRVIGLRLGQAKTRIRRANCSVGSHPPRPLQASRPRDRPEPEGRQGQAQGLPGQAGGRPALGTTT